MGKTKYKVVVQLNPKYYDVIYGTFAYDQCFCAETVLA
jgi:hypothetical protein